MASFFGSIPVEIISGVGYSSSLSMKTVPELEAVQNVVVESHLQGARAQQEVSESGTIGSTCVSTSVLYNENLSRASKSH